MSKYAANDVKFTAIDGEGYDKNRHHYYNLLLARSHDYNATCYITPGIDANRLVTWEIFDFVENIKRPANTVFVAFYFNYDVAKWIEDIPNEKKIELQQNGSVYVKSVFGEWWHITYIPRKIFKLQKINDYGRGREFICYDVFGFFQCSFVKALENWKIPGYEFIKEMKAKRGTFKVEELDTIIQYTTDECDKLCILMNNVRDALVAENIPITQWYGAGAIAAAVLKKHKSDIAIATKHFHQIRNMAPEFEESILGSYFGGRFELFRQGIIPRHHQYDINSAYPSAMSQLPSFDNCKVEFHTEYNKRKYSIWYVTYDVIEDDYAPFIGPFPYRTHEGNIGFPYFNPYGVWIHQIELQTAIRLYGFRNFEIHCGFSFTPRNTKPAFTYINDMAARRLQLKQNGDLRNVVLKLGLNSLYGKTAQSQSQPDKIPPFQNYYIAGLITAITRAKLLEIGVTCGNNGSGIIQFATDGIFSTRTSKSIKQSTQILGEWEYDISDTPTLFIQPGVYYSQDNKTSNVHGKRRTRGFNANSLSADAVFREWKRNGPDGQCTVTEKRFIGIGGCIVRNNFRDYGKFIQERRTLSFGNPWTKQYANMSGEPIHGKEAWDWMHPKIYGIDKKEVVGYRDYEILIPFPEVIDDGPSKLYVPRKMRDAENVPEQVRELLAYAIIDSEQPDFEEENYELEAYDY